MTATDAHDPAFFMDADVYQGLSIRTDWPDWTARKDEGVIHAALMLASEAGEVAGIVQKWHGQGHMLGGREIQEELGDCLWAICKLARCLDIPLSRIMAANVAKLDARYPDGFDAARSINREDAP